jgi:hypothetical protein
MKFASKVKEETVTALKPADAPTQPEAKEPPPKTTELKDSNSKILKKPTKKILPKKDSKSNSETKKGNSAQRAKKSPVVKGPSATKHPSVLQTLRQSAPDAPRQLYLRHQQLAFKHWSNGVEELSVPVVIPGEIPKRATRASQPSAAASLLELDEQEMSLQQEILSLTRREEALSQSIAEISANEEAQAARRPLPYPNAQIKRELEQSSPKQLTYNVPQALAVWYAARYPNDIYTYR